MIQEFLMDHGAFRSWDDYDDCLFAAETVNGTILVFDENFQKEVFQKYLETYKLSTKDTIAMFDDDEAAEAFGDEHDRCFSDDMDALGISIENDEISFKDKTDADSWDLRDLLEELGWECDFEGDSWKLETIGVYFIR